MIQLHDHFKMMFQNCFMEKYMEKRQLIKPGKKLIN